MKGIVVYKGKYGATAQYANWLSEELNVPVCTAGDLSTKDLQPYDLVIIGTSVYIGKLQISQWLKDNLAVLKSKKLFLFLVAGTPPHEKEKLEAYIRSGVPAELMANCIIFFLPGRLTIKKLSWKDRFMLKMGARLTKDPAVKKGMLTDYDHVKRENIIVPVKEIKKYCITFASPAETA
ncbi:flavodoxin domain-containing protein [Terrimonas pollutisoli]|uniref:flavodoxin domain-containing protein n=1 Tax=Terrimonas pollutisoli TaxID=3034147 RepID=UPI0023EC2480|nr:flavodoxin domain-containing protein [Terrimonas sp. H1YJ31]